MAVPFEGGSNYRNKLAQRQAAKKRRQQAGLRNTAANAGPPSSSNTKVFSTPAPKEESDKGFSAGGFAKQMLRRYTINPFKGAYEVAKDTATGGDDSLKAPPWALYLIPGMGLGGAAAQYNYYTNEKFSDALAPADVIGLGGLLRGAARAATSRGGKATIAGLAGAAGIGVGNEDTAEARIPGAAARASVYGEDILSALGRQGLSKTIIKELESGSDKVLGPVREAIESNAINPAQTYRVTEGIRDLLRQSVGAAHTTARGTFKKGVKGKGPLTEMIYGTKGTVEDLARGMEGFASRAPYYYAFEGVAPDAASQLPYWARTIQGGVERSNKWGQVRFPEFESVKLPKDIKLPDEIKVPNLQELLAMADPNVFSSGVFRDPGAAVTDVARAMRAMSTDLPGVAPFGFQLGRRKGGKQGIVSFTPPGEHTAGASFTGASTVGKALQLIDQGVDNVYDLATGLSKRLEAGQEALSGTAMPKTTVEFNTGLKGSGSLTDAIKRAEEIGSEALMAPIREGAETRKLYDEKVRMLRGIDPSFLTDEAQRFFAQEIKPIVKFGESTFGTGENAFDAYTASQEELRKLSRLLLRLAREG